MISEQSLCLLFVRINYESRVFTPQLKTLTLFSANFNVSVAIFLK